MNNIILLGSAPTIERINKLINSYFFSDKELIKLSDSEYQIKGQKGIIDNFRVIYKNKRFRFEQI